jgi:hypothetical protein
MQSGSICLLPKRVVGAVEHSGAHRQKRIDALRDPAHPSSLRTAGLVDPGTGSTFEALERRGYIVYRHTGFPEDPLVSIQITPAGRKLVRPALSIQLPKRLPTGSLREWHWRALALAYAARQSGGIKQEGSYYGRIGWNTQLIEVDNKGAVFLIEMA